MSTTAYPRRCGENHVHVLVRDTHGGLPPQVRGELGAGQPCGRLSGLTPAGAGRTAGRCHRVPTRRAYPRRCGENQSRLSGEIDDQGLPPQVRGERPALAAGRRFVGLTPAGAGRTSVSTLTLLGMRAYPRRCGENLASTLVSSSGRGLPPQVRGEHGVNLVTTQLGGLTPAGAGRTWGESCYYAAWWAYPRRCGENFLWRSRPVGRVGLPPQVRGERADRAVAFAASGLTPAGAGRTISWVMPMTSAAAYPRRCGENLRHHHKNGTKSGLPPQVRGEHGVNLVTMQLGGLTPAGAGRTSWSISAPVWWWGLPPQVRGELVDGDPSALESGLTPAGAGRTPTPRCRAVPD